MSELMQKSWIIVVGLIGAVAIISCVCFLWKIGYLRKFLNNLGRTLQEDKNISPEEDIENIIRGNVEPPTENVSEVGGNVDNAADLIPNTSTERTLVDGVVVVVTEIGVLLPFVGRMIEVCVRIVDLFNAYQDLEKNCKEIVRWCKAIEDILERVRAQAVVFVELEKKIDMNSLCTCQEKMNELLKLAEEHNSFNLVLKFALSKETKSLMEEVSRWLTRAVSTLELNIAITSLEVNMRIERDVKSLITAVDGVQVQLQKVLELSLQIQRNQENGKVTSEISSKEVDPDDDQVMTEESMDKMSLSLKKLEVLPTSIRRIQDAPIGIGRFSKVYKVEYMGNTRAAKVIQVAGLSLKLLQKVYLRFAKELYILSELHGPRIVSLHGCANTLTEMTLILEYMSKGCLRTLLRKEMEWRELSPSQRHRILLDTAEGMLFLHDNNVAHRDLKSANILITDDFRGKLTDFGLSKTTDAITFGTASNFAGQTIAWQAPERFHEGVVNHFKADCYSFGIVAWEVLTGVLGEVESRPWAGKSDGQITLAVLNGERPALPDACITDINVQTAKTVERVMNQCLDGDPEKRPSFVENVVLLSTSGC